MAIRYVIERFRFDAEPECWFNNRGVSFGKFIILAAIKPEQVDALRTEKKAESTIFEVGRCSPIFRE